jgi:hypothetical protein
MSNESYFFVTDKKFALNINRNYVYDNEGNWKARIKQTIESFEDLFLESGLNHAYLDVNIKESIAGVIE